MAASYRRSGDAAGESPKPVPQPGVTVEVLGTRRPEVRRVIPLLLVLLLVLLLFGAGFAVKALWWIALVVLVVWLLGFVVRPGTGAGRGRWYRW